MYAGLSPTASNSSRTRASRSLRVRATPWMISGSAMMSPMVIRGLRLE